MGRVSGIPKKLLIVLHGAIGDVVRALPLALRIKGNWPDIELHWAVEPIAEPILRGHHALNKIIVFDRPRGFPAFVEFIKRLRAENYDLVLDLQRHLKSGLTSFLTGAPRRIGFHRANAKELNWLFNNEHIAEVENFSLKIRHYQEFGDLLGLAPLEPFVFGLEAEPEACASLEVTLQREAGVRGIALAEKTNFAVLIVGSTWESRFWFAERYAALIALLQQKFGCTSLLIGGKREEAFAGEILAHLAPGSAVLNLVSKTSLSELVALFHRAALAVGSDSGPMHIAAACGLPIVSIWGPTSALRSAPFGSEDYILQPVVACAPCYRRKCPGLGQLCMKEHAAEDVIRKIEQMEAQGKLALRKDG